MSLFFTRIRSLRSFSLEVSEETAVSSELVFFSKCLLFNKICFGQQMLTCVGQFHKTLENTGFWDRKAYKTGTVGYE